MDQRKKNDHFRALHRNGEPLIVPNPWDEGSARILEGAGFQALATTSAGFALTRGRRDYSVTREEALEHCRRIASAVAIPVSADLENGFGRTPEDVYQTVRFAAQTGLCGGSIEDTTGDVDEPIVAHSLAIERVAAAAQAARESGSGFVLTARAEAYLHRQGELDGVIERLVAFEAAGADVLYAPGLPNIEAVRAVCAALSKPVNVLVIGRLTQHPVSAFAEAGVARISIGGALAFSVYGALLDVAKTLQQGSLEGVRLDRERSRRLSSYLD